MVAIVTLTILMHIYTQFIHFAQRKHSSMNICWVMRLTMCY